MIKRIGLLLLILWSAGSIYAVTNQNDGVSVVFGSHYLFVVKAPKNWILDNEFARSQGLVNFFYPAGNQNNKQEVYLYSLGYSKPAANFSVDDYINYDIKRMKSIFTNLVIIPRKVSLEKTEPIRNVKIMEFQNFNNIYKEIVCYIETERSICTLIFSSQKKKSYDRYIPDFDEFVSSFTFLTNDPEEMMNRINSNPQKEQETTGGTEND